MFSKMSLLDKQIVSYQGGLTRVKFLIFLLLTLSCSIEDDNLTNNITLPNSIKALQKNQKFKK